MMSPADMKRYRDSSIDYEIYYRSHKQRKENYSTDYTFEGYLALSRFFQGIFISDHGYIIDTGNFETVNLVLMEKVIRKIEKHPILWKLFFLIA